MKYLKFKYLIYFLCIQGPYYGYKAYPFQSYYNMFDLLTCVISLAAVALHFRTQHRIKQNRTNRAKLYALLKATHVAELSERDLRHPTNVYTPPSIV